MNQSQPRQQGASGTSHRHAGQCSHGLHQRWRWSIAAALILNASLSFAQPQASVGMVADPCPHGQAAGPAPQLAALLELMMKPEPFDPQVVTKLQAPSAASDAKAQEEQRKQDWPNLCRYRAQNASLAGNVHPRVVFMGDSITEFWSLADPGFFTHGIIDRGISGQTSPQMLVRFYADVIALHPKVVHILAGTNDLAGNTGPTTAQDYQNNVSAMCDLAAANGIRVILGSIPPAGAFPWHPGIKPAAQIIELNAWMRRYALEHHLQYVDYHAALSAPDGSMRSDLTHDGIHPHRRGYALMRPLAEQAIRKALD